MSRKNDILVFSKDELLTLQQILDVAVRKGSFGITDCYVLGLLHSSIASKIKIYSDIEKNDPDGLQEDIPTPESEGI
jgi:hypothetical protein